MNEQEKKDLETKKPEDLKSFIKNNLKLVRITLVLIIITIFTGYKYFNPNNKPKEILKKETIVEKIEKDKIYIFFPKDGELENIEIEIKKVKNSSELIKVTLRNVIEKLSENGNIPQIDIKKDVEFYLVDRKIYLDIPEKIFEKVKNPREELLIIYSFVNSLTTIRDISEVKILINNSDIGKVKYANLKKEYVYKKNI